MTESGPERPLEGWKYAYVAGAVDFGSNLKLSVTKADDRLIGYAIVPSLEITNRNRAVIGFIDEFCEQHDLEPNLRSDKGSYILSFTKRDHLRQFLELVRPFLVARYEAVEILVDELISELKAGKGSSKEGFCELMGVVDRIRDLTYKNTVKYDQAHFRDQWNM